MSTYNVYFAPDYASVSKRTFIGEFEGQGNSPSYDARSAARDQHNPTNDIFNYFARLKADDNRR